MTLTDMDMRSMAHAIQNLSDLPIYVNDSWGTTLLDIKSFCRKLKAEQGIGLIVIDYLQLMKPHVRKQSREQEIAEISRGSKSWPKN
jgi:replicative DNA helicase